MINQILERPFFYNLRFLIAGNQGLTRDFVSLNYHQYHCHSVLDVGCGTGDFAPLFPVKDYLGIDINPQYITFAQKRYPHRFLCQDATNYDFPKHFDASIMISTLHHLDNQQAENLLSTLIKITQKIIIVVDLNTQTNLIKKLFIKLDRSGNVRTTEEKIALLTRFGKIVKLVHFSTGLASQTGIILLPNHEKS